MNTRKILIADDHPLVLNGLFDLLKSLNFGHIIKAEDGIEAYNIIIKEKPEIAILDIRMPKMSGLEIARKCKLNKGNTKVILITLHQEKALFEEAMKLDIFGYLFKQFTLQEIEECISEVIKGNRFFSSKLKAYVNETNAKNSILDMLTPSETKILKLISNNMTTPQIANDLFISSRTVEKHRNNIAKKLKLGGKTNSLLLWAKQNEYLFKR